MTADEGSRVLLWQLLAEAAEPQPEPQRDMDSYGRSRISPDAAPLVTCVNGTQANFHGREEVIWGSRGRRFKSCQPRAGSPTPATQPDKLPENRCESPDSPERFTER